MSSDALVSLDDSQLAMVDIYIYIYILVLVLSFNC